MTHDTILSIVEVTLGSSCAVNAACLDSNAECISSVCECETGYYNDSGSCVLCKYTVLLICISYVLSEIHDNA